MIMRKNETGQTVLGGGGHQPCAVIVGGAVILRAAAARHRSAVLPGVFPVLGAGPPSPPGAPAGVSQVRIC